MPTATKSKWFYYPTESAPVPVADLGKLKCVYLADRRAHRDPTIVWGTTFDAQPMADFVAAESRRCNVMYSPAHLLISAVARTLAEHPGLNRKVIGRRVYQYKEINIVIPLLTPVDKQVNPVFIRGVEDMSLRDIATHLWNEARNRGVQAAEERKRDALRTPWQRFWVQTWRTLTLHGVLRFTGLGFAAHNQTRRRNVPANDTFNGVSALVNFLSFPSGAPSMVSFKPSSLPMNAASLTVTMAAPEWRPAVVGGQVVAQKVAPLFIKADHRLVHAHEIAAFMNTLCGYMTQPGRLTATEPQTNAVAPAPLSKAA
ncbi:MAG TPA: 2-oxo acid dehydrogenase subunit E2 [Planctomycetaceae bacterium]|jgi:hypothetical protein